MRVFKDNEGISWNIEILVETVLKIRAEYDVDLVGLTPEALGKLEDDPIVLCQIIWALCEEQAKPREMDVKAFARAVAGDPLDAAWEAISGAISDFSRGRKRSRWQKVLALTAKMHEKEDKLLERAEDPEILKQIDEAMEARANEALKTALTRLSSATTSPESRTSGQSDEP